METRNKLNPVEELKIQINAVAVLIEKIIHLDAMRTAKQSADDKLHEAKQKQRTFYDESRIPSTSQNLQFLNDTVYGKEYQRTISTINRDVNSIEQNIRLLEREKEIRMKPFNDLWDHVTNPQTDIHERYVKTLLNNAKILNPEGSLCDILQTIGEILKNIITLRLYEIGAACQAQQTKNCLRSSIAGLFKRDFSEAKPDKEPATKPGLSR